MIQLAIADDEALFRKGLKLLLEADNDIHVQFEAGNGRELIEQLQITPQNPDIILLDMNMPELNGIETAKKLAHDYPGIRFIVLSGYYSHAHIVNMIEMGAAAYLAKNADPAEVSHTIREVHKNGFFYDAKVMEVIRDNMIQKTKPKIGLPFGIELTPREKEILQLICEEYTTGEIATKLFLSPRTVDGHRNNLMEKLGCRNVAGLVLYAIQHQLVKSEAKSFGK